MMCEETRMISIQETLLVYIELVKLWAVSLYVTLG